MSESLKSEIQALVENLIDSRTGQTYGAGKAVTGVGLDGARVAVDLRMNYACQWSTQAIEEQVAGVLEAHPQIDTAVVNVDWRVLSHRVQKQVDALANVKNTIAVASGKGGVGKSTVSANLAAALVRQGARVGLLDADIYGPSQPRMMGLSGRPDSKDGKTIEPKVAHQIQTMSIGYLIDEDTPMIWRGPMVTQALQQLIGETQWDSLDYLVIDLPPGTGDIQLTLSQRIPVSASLIVTTPQDIALLDARKALRMFEKVEVPVLGVVENMSMHICSQCGHQEAIFGSGGASRMAEEYGVDLLGELPLDLQIRKDVDEGTPTVVADPEGSVTDAFLALAGNVAGRLSVQAARPSAVFPKIVVADT